MAAKVLLGPRQVILLKTGFRSLAMHLRTLSSGDGPNHPIVITHVHEPEESLRSEIELNLLGPADKRFTLPGNIGLATQLISNVKLSSSPPVQVIQPKVTSLNEDDLLTTTLLGERSAIPAKQQEEMFEVDPNLPDIMLSTAVDMLECVAQPCPQLLRREFQKMFPDQDLFGGNLTVVTLSQKTRQDMSEWSQHVEEEREDLLMHFCTAAEEICNQLAAFGYWADFIDPASGRSYRGPYTPTTMFETDERYRHLGFEIEDLGCCRVIRHHKWGTRSFVGCLLTSAPVHSKELKEILAGFKQYNDDGTFSW